MLWSKIKTIILVLLLIVNAALLGLVGWQALRSSAMTAETRQRMVTILNGNGIAYLPEQVPGEMPLTPVRVAVVPPGENEAGLLLGEIQDVASVGARTTYTGQRGAAEFSDSGELRAAFPAEDVDQVLTLLSSVGVELFPLGEEGYAQLWQGRPVLGRPVGLTQAEGVWQVSLRRLAGEAEPLAPERRAMNAVTTLTRFLEALNRGGYVCREIRALYPAWMASGTLTVTLTPCWCVETDAWPWRYAVDAYTGAVTAGVQ